MTAPVPVATYRLQLTPSFGFGDVIRLLDHVERLGCSHVYLSPIAQAVPESTHGYDVVDHTTVRSEFGGSAGFEVLLDAVAARGMGVLFDHVPNHVSSTRADLNRPWWGLLREGQGSRFDDWFDVDWQLTGGRVILPILGAPLSDVVADGDLSVDGDELVVYGERRLPLAAGTAHLELPELIDAQHYRLQHWRDPQRNVRRFFTIDDLVAVRVEHDHVAETVDTLPSRYASNAGFAGVRVDHVDGLADPASYLGGLRSRIGDEALLYVEKILAPGEWLPSSWPVDGTTGYEFITSVDHVLLASGAASTLDEQWVRHSTDPRSFHEYETQARAEVVDEALAPDLARVTRVAATAVEDRGGDVGAEVRRLTTSLPRYRTYLPDDPDADRLIGEVSQGPVARSILAAAEPVEIELRTRWQQLTGPVMAKGAEDRSFYRYLRLASLCEVGGDPGSFAIGVDRFHADNVERQRAWPRALLAASTHDTKRSDDVRARSTALTWLIDDVAPAWDAAVVEVAERTGLDRVAATLAVQSAITTPGLDAARLADYLVKACREAAVHTRWEQVDDRYERRLTDAAAMLVGRSWPSVIDRVATSISLVSTVLRLTSPGVPDIYQGTEAFSYRLVDPDNRVPPDWRSIGGASQDRRSVADLWTADEPAMKTVLVRDVLALRRRHLGAFAPNGSYSPIEVGEGGIAYARGDDVIVVARRGLADFQRAIDVPSGDWVDVLDPDRRVSDLDIAVLERVG